MGNRICTAVTLSVVLLLFDTAAHAQQSGCVQSSSSSWTDRSFTTQTAQFTATYDATPSQASMNGVIGFSLNAASSNSNLATITRFATNGRIDVRNGGAYAADVSLPYSPGVSYHFRLAINPSTKRYDVYVTPSGQAEVALATNYAFRSEQSTTSSLNNWGMFASSGAVTVCNMAVGAPAAPPVITTQPTSQTVTVGQTATFSVAATGTAPFAYQWRKNGVNISGASSSSYTTPATTTADSGAQFSVFISNSVGSVTSSSATLTVNAATVAPSITTQPSSQTVTAGQTATFSVAATGTAPLNYQWLKNGVNISGATSSSYTTPATTTGDSGAQFSVVVSNSAGSVTSNGATLTVNASSGCPCTIWTSTAVPAVADGGPDSPVELGVTFRSDTSGYITGIRFYKSSGNTGTHVGNVWSSTGALLATATFSGESASGWQQVNFSSPVAVTANTAYVASYHANSGHYSADQNYFSTSGVDKPPLHAIANGSGGLNGAYAYGSSSSFPNATWNSTNYWVDVVFNTSVTAMPVAPTITTQPASTTVIAGQTATFSVTATGTAPLSYQWRKNGANISGATSSSYTTPATATADTGAQFSAVVSNSASSATSSIATLTVNAATVAPTITTQPVSQTIVAGQAATFSAAATGTAPLAYQWRKNGANISGATSSSYTTPATTTADNGAQFSVVVSNSAGTATSGIATLTVNAAAVAPAITTQPASSTVVAGQTATFSVAASGTAPLAYQWRKNGANISGATSSSYTTPATTTADSGAQFSVVVSNSAGTATSGNATLTVGATTKFLSPNPTSLSFGNVSVSLSSLLTSTLTNTGNSNVTISGVSISGAGLTVSGLSTGQIIAPGQSAILSVVFLPLLSGNMSGSVVVTSNASNSPTTIPLSGTGVLLVTHSATLSWGASSSPVVGYNVYSGTASGGPYNKITTSAVATVSYQDSSVQSGKTYYYVVTAINSSSVESAYSNQVVAAIP